jgi:acyl-CoA reductase-like NAD-dependent aldehyde dehydrogenase
MTNSDDVPAVPLWLAGHAYLTLARRFVDVREACSGRVLRRTPLCGADEVRRALNAARQTQPDWHACAAGERSRLLADLGGALLGYADHFARLIEDESGGDGASASAEVREAVAVLRAVPSVAALPGSLVATPPACVVAIVGSAHAPLGALLRVAVPAWRAGAALVVLQPPRVPGAVFALAELSARCAFPAGVFNVLYGDAALIDGELAAGECVLHTEGDERGKRPCAAATSARQDAWRDDAQAATP